MRFANFAAILFAGIVLAKNVVYLDDLRAAIDAESENSENGKRDAKNVVSLDDLKAAIDKLEHKANNVNDVKKFFSRLGKRDQEVVKFGTPLLQNLLPQILSASIFAGYLRDDQELLGEAEKTDSFTILVAPSDNAMATKLNGVKPWEFPKKIMDDATDDEVVAYNIDHFLRAHMLTRMAKVASDSELKSTLLDGREFVVKNDAATGTYRIKVDGKWIGVTSMTLADNGIVFVIEDVLSLPEA